MCVYDGLLRWRLDTCNTMRHFWLRRIIATRPRNSFSPGLSFDKTQSAALDSAKRLDIPDSLSRHAKPRSHRRQAKWQTSLAYSARPRPPTQLPTVPCSWCTSAKRCPATTTSPFSLYMHNAGEQKRADLSQHQHSQPDDRILRPASHRSPAEWLRPAGLPFPRDLGMR